MSHAAFGSMLDPDACSRAVVSRDPRFDGVFFVGISTTRIYCRPVCPARVSYPERRRFFPSAAAAERNGFRPCLRCRPELAPGRAVCDAVPRVARAAAMRIAAGALNGRTVADLAEELGVSERHLRRSMERELGVAPIELAQTHRLLLAKCLLTDTSLPVTRVAFASGFQSLRRFNSVFRQRYRMSPSVLRQRPRPSGPAATKTGPAGDWIRLTLGYRPPLDWNVLVRTIASDTPAGVGVLERSRFSRTVAVQGCRGVISLKASATAPQVNVDFSVSLVPALMPLLARLRHLLDLDAEPAVIDRHLAESGLARLIQGHPGLRMAGAFDGFEVAVRELLGADLLGRVTQVLGEPLATSVPLLDRLAITAERVEDAGAPGLSSLGVPQQQAEVVVTLAGQVAEGTLRLEPGADVQSILRKLEEIPGIGAATARSIVIRALHWPDEFPSTDRAIQRAAGVTGMRELRQLAERWRPWRSYAAAHLTLTASRTESQGYPESLEAV